MELSFNLKFVEEYYTNKIKEHGPNSKGVDWKDSESQNLRFFHLLREFNITKDDSILDYGCGYGALLKYLSDKIPFKSYLGYDISTTMLDAARNLFQESKNIEWSNYLSNDKNFDYVFLSGVFNVRNEISDNDWLQYILNTLHKVDNYAKKGFSFNLLSLYSDIEYRKEYLYYADPLFLFDYCKKNFSRFVSLFHDYPLYEFTLSVKKE